MIDLDVVDACGEALLHQAGHVVLPWYPHVANAPGARPLPDLLGTHSILRRLAAERRLLWYDLRTAPRRHGPGPVVDASFFSAEAAVSLLALAGVRRVRSLGVDGGAGYSADFEDLADRTLLANGQPGFDLQFQGIARTILRTGVDFAPLDQPSPIVVCVPAAPATALPERVLEYSVRRHTSRTVAMHFIRSPGDLDAIPVPRDDSAAAAEWRRAIVLRPDTLVLDDLRKPWTRPRVRAAAEVPPAGGMGARAELPPIAVVTTPAAQWPGPVLQAESEPAASVASLPAEWGRRDRFEAGRTALLQYAAPTSQPWVSRAHPYGHLWVAMLLEAVRDGFITLDFIRQEIARGHVRPSLLAQVEQGRPESLLLPASARRRDAGFTLRGGAPPARAAVLLDPIHVLQALARDARRRLGVLYRRHAARSHAAFGAGPGALTFGAGRGELARDDSGSLPAALPDRGGDT